MQLVTLDHLREAQWQLLFGRSKVTTCKEVSTVQEQHEPIKPPVSSWKGVEGWRRFRWEPGLEPLDPQQGTKVLLLCQTQSGFHGYGSIALKHQRPGDDKVAAKGQSSDCFRWLGRWEPSSRCDPLPGPPVTRRGGSGHQRGYLPTTCRDSDHFDFNFEDKEYLPQLRPSYSGTSKNQWLKFRLR